MIKDIEIKDFASVQLSYTDSVCEKFFDEAKNCIKKFLLYNTKKSLIKSDLYNQKEKYVLMLKPTKDKYTFNMSVEIKPIK